MPVPSAPARRMAASASAATARSVTPGWIAAAAALSPMIRAAGRRVVSRRARRATSPRAGRTSRARRRPTPCRAGPRRARRPCRRRGARGPRCRAGGQARRDRPGPVTISASASSPAEGIVLVRMRELAQHAARRGSFPTRSAYWSLSGPQARTGSPAGGTRTGHRLEVDGDVRQPADVRRHRTPRDRCRRRPAGPDPSARHQRLDTPPSARVLLGRDGRSGDVHGSSAGIAGRRGSSARRATPARRAPRRSPRAPPPGGPPRRPCCSG